MIRGRLRQMKLSLFFSMIVLMIFLITSIIIGIITLLALQYGVVDKLGIRHSVPILLATLPASVIVGTLVALVFGRFPLRPIREIIAATNKLAAGDFTARIAVSHTPELRELRESFNRMAEELNSTEMLRSDFINNFSHEFKTPIVSIKGFAELLKADDLPKQERDEYLDIIIRESSRLSMLATNVLNLSKVEHQTIVADQARFDLSEQVRRCILLLQSAWEQKEIVFEIELDEVAVYANEEMVSQVWLNLIDNAIKFSYQGGRVVIQLSKTGDGATFAIRDYGRGISEQDQKHVFDRFYQSDSSRTLPGNGLGLTLAQRIVLLHNGTIACESVLGHYTEFTVHLPKGHGYV